MELLGPVDISETWYRRPRIGPLIFLRGGADTLGLAH
jgi:hypothetical protein